MELARRERLSDDFHSPSRPLIEVSIAFFGLYIIM